MLNERVMETKTQKCLSLKKEVERKEEKVTTEAETSLRVRSLMP
jgi:hypothetical protein